MKKKLRIFYLNLITIFDLGFELSKVDIAKSFKRSKLGIFWISLTALVYIFSIGYVFPLLSSSISLEESILNVSMGIIFWFFFSLATRESCDAYILHIGLIFSQNINYIALLLKIFFKHLVIFFINIIFLIIFCIIFFKNMNYIGFFFSTLVFIIITFNVSLICSIIAVRYRDFSSALSLILQLGFILSPIIWSEKIIEGNEWLLNFNIFYHLVAFPKKIILGDENSFLLIVNSFYLFLSAIFAYLLYIKKKKYITIWL